MRRYNQYFDFVVSELNELETRDVGQLFECLKEHLEDMGQAVNETDLYTEIGRQVDAEVRADEYMQLKNGGAK